MTTVPVWDLPPRLARGLDLRHWLSEQGLWFAPIRHHSPACARATLALIERVRPKAILIEGPEQYAGLMPLLQDPRTRPPVAVFAVQSADHGTIGSFYPLADFSPEWVGLREAARLGVPAVFIDQWVRDRDATAGTLARTLQQERYYAHSRTLAGLAQREHCRDSDELWEHMFEMRTGETETLFEEVFVWSALARLDYEPEVLLAEGTLTREALMMTRIKEWLTREDGPVVCITGAFHTLGLVEALAAEPADKRDGSSPRTNGTVPVRGQMGRFQFADNRNRSNAGDPGQLIRDQVPKRGYPPPPDPAVPPDNAWLIRYNLTQLDGLRGYGAGMPSPGYYQRLWDATGPESEPPPAPVRSATAVACLADIARTANDAHTADQISIAEVQAAAAQAEGLARLRGHAWPGRTDILDACSSCFVRGETGAAPALRDAIAVVFGGATLGTVPETAAQPPIIAEAKATAAKLRFVISDSTRRTVKLDVHRNVTARRRSRFLSLMSYLETGFATRVAGPDYVAGWGLTRLFEQWEYAWTPLVEASLVRLAGQAASLEQAASVRLLEEEAELAETGQAQSAHEVAALLAQAATIGLNQEAAHFRTRLASMIEQDPSLESVVGAAGALLRLWRSRDVLEIANPGQLLDLVALCLPQVAYLIGGFAGLPEDREETMIGALVALRDLVRQLTAINDQSVPAHSERFDFTGVRQALHRARIDPETPPGIEGALYAMAVTDGEVDDEDLAQWLRVGFAPGADPDHAVRRLDGLMRVAPDLLLHTPELLAAADAVIANLHPDTFLNYLPDLRHSFAALKPVETAALARQIAVNTGFETMDLAPVTDATTADLAQGANLELALRASLADDRLTDWVAT